MKTTWLDSGWGLLGEKRMDSDPGLVLPTRGFGIDDFVIPGFHWDYRMSPKILDGLPL